MQNDPISAMQNALANLSQLYSDANQAVKNYFNFLFERHWEQLKTEYKEEFNSNKVKKNFVREISLLIYNIFNTIPDEYKTTTMIEIPEIIRYVFKYHYLHNYDKSDQERAANQKDEGYRQQICDDVIRIFLKTPKSDMLCPVITKYDPITYTLEELCDLHLAILHKGFDVHFHNENEKDDFRALILYNLFVNAFFKIKSVLNQLTNTVPSEAAITWRSLFELEHTINIVNAYDYDFSKIYADFLEFKLSDEDDVRPELMQKISSYAEKYSKKTNDLNFKNYGWILHIDDSLPMNFKSLLKLCKDEERYENYRKASHYVHANADPMRNDMTELSNFTIRQLHVSVANIVKDINRYYEYYRVDFKKDDLSDVINELNGAVRRYNDAYKKFNNALK